MKYKNVKACVGEKSFQKEVWQDLKWIDFGERQIWVPNTTQAPFNHDPQNRRSWLRLFAHL